MIEDIRSGASFSDDREYRYLLWRYWGELDHGKRINKEMVLFVCLNPSTADETKDDPTVRRCIGFAKRWGWYSGIYLCNLFALRSTDPGSLNRHYEPVGMANNLVIKTARSQVSLAVAAWGNHGVIKDRGREVADMIAPCYCFGVTKSGQPKHPLYVPYGTVFRKYGGKLNIDLELYK